MRFGIAADDAKTDPRLNRPSGFLKFLKEGDTTFRILQEPKDWIYFAKHFSDAGSFPCNGETTCPGCTNDNPKVARAGAQVAFNVHQGDYVEVMEIPRRVADKFQMRFDRIGTVTDRDYTVTKYKNSSNKFEYDVEGETPTKVDLSQFELKDIEMMLQNSWNEMWGSSQAVEAAKKRAESRQQQKTADETVAKREASQDDVPPFKEPAAQNGTPAAGEGDVEVTEESLRAMSLFQLAQLCAKENITLPENLNSTDEVVNWLLAQQQG